MKIFNAIQSSLLLTTNDSLPTITVTENRQIKIEHYETIIKFLHNELLLKSNEYKIHIKGEKFIIHQFTKDQIILLGIIDQVLFIQDGMGRSE